MKVRMILTAGLSLVLVMTGCGGSHASVRFRNEDTSNTPGTTSTWAFDSDATGQSPAAAEVFSGDWEVRPMDDAPSPPNVLCQVGVATYPAMALSNGVYGDLTFATQFKPISGKEDQAGGLLFRVQDRDNYYIVRANALEGNVTFFKYAAGSRSELKSGPADIVAGQWHELQVEVKGNHFQAFLDRQPVVETSDDTYGAGRVGLWTKADSLTCFDSVAATVP